MNIFNGLGNFGGEDNCICKLIWIMLLLQMCGCENNIFGGIDCKTIILLLLLTNICGCREHTPCGN